MNFLHYFQILASIPIGLRPKPASEPRPAESSLEDDAMFHLFNDKSILLSKMRSKDYYLFFQEKKKTEITATAVNTWSKPEAHNPGLLSKYNIDIKSNGKICLKIYRGYQLTTN